MEPHIQRTVERIKEDNSNYILAIQDQTYLNYTSHPAKTELGRISNVTGKHHQYGLIQHSVLCVNDKNEPLGLLDVQHFDFDDFANTVNSDKRTLETKKTRYWVDAFNKLHARLGSATTKVITVADREGDFLSLYMRSQCIKQVISFVANMIGIRVKNIKQVKNFLSV